MFDDKQNNQNLGQTLGQSSAPKMAPPLKLPTDQKMGGGVPDDILSEVNRAKPAGPSFANPESQKPAFFTPTQQEIAAQPIPLAPAVEQPELGGAIPYSGGGQQQPPTQSASPDQMLNGVEDKKLSTVKKILIIIVTVVLVVALAGLGYWLYQKLGENDFVDDNLDLIPAETADTEEEILSPDEEAAADALDNREGDTQELEQENEDQSMDDEAVVPIFPLEPVAPVDTDGDGLTDEEELVLGTNINDSDSDKDALSDRDEVEVYKTDPLNPDSDGDGYLDGDEVENGYDPKGPGRLFDLP